jgi:tRNA A37 methylthiotransferase MiaB
MFIAEGHFHHVGVFAYSNEEESKAFNLEGQISEDEKQDRLERLMLAQQGVVEGRNSELLGNSERVLIERVSEQPEALLEGRAAWQAPEVDSNCLISRIKGPNDVMIPDSDLSSFLGQFLTVRHMSTSGYDLVSEIVVDTA